VAPAHPLCGQLLEASAFRRLNGTLYLVVRLPDGSPGTIAAAATSVWEEPTDRAAAVVLDVEGLRALRRRVEALAPAVTRVASRARKGK